VWQLLALKIFKMAAVAMVTKIQNGIINGMKKSWEMVVLVIIFTDFCVVFLDFVLLFDIFHLFIDSAFRLICSLPLPLKVF
jgi:hypothetical protein